MKDPTFRQVKSMGLAPEILSANIRVVSLTVLIGWK